MAEDADCLVQAIRPVARSYFPPETSPAHDWFHVQRVETNAERLLAELPDADTECVQLAVLLHDIGRAKEDAGEIEDHAAWGADESERILREHGAAEGATETVSHCVRAHRYSNDVEPATIEAKIVSDADNLDAMGAVGVARCFAYGGELGSPIHDPSLPPEDDPTSAGKTQCNHLHAKILDLPNRMYTDAGRDLADGRTGFVREFLAQFERETAGER
ncbi:uncharacterized protein SAMN05216559_1689 [Halomicrobium zhouii]|uniref:HD domain-containing protein n=1 Tax=Halomicrobium zhouii TaxID=767519 RepID=A0A1I6KZQ1_9EURY|nr:HD domain-containing protein [Halomicrobium zhouii]SFR96706.1 uncharacterized protein SAMN05216559_1689 [Halomicrobium zhouii]